MCCSPFGYAGLDTYQDRELSNELMRVHDKRIDLEHDILLKGAELNVRLPL
jgi:hypothetical protein